MFEKFFLSDDKTIHMELSKTHNLTIVRLNYGLAICVTDSASKELNNGLVFSIEIYNDSLMPIIKICYCQDCGWKGKQEQTEPIAHIFERVAPGEPMPAGQCPECGALCQIKEKTNEIS
jgi:hypothetical protein